MSTRLLIAPAGHGKTAHAIKAIRGLPPLSSVRVLVPDQIEARAFRRRMAQAGGAIGVQVQTFYGLYTDVLSLAGQTLHLPQPQPAEGMPHLTPAIRQRLIRHVAGRLYDTGRLSYYAPVHSSLGFARLLGGLYGELKRARVFPEALEDALTGSEPRLSELAHLYSAYQEWLLNTGWIDADGQGWLAAIALEQNPVLLSDLALLVVDGFDEFNPTQLHLLRLMSDRANRTLITLIGDPQRPDRLAHRRLKRARDVLVKELDVEPVSLTRTGRGGSLAHIEADLFEPGIPPVACDGAVAFVEVQNRASEAREALRWLKARLVRDHIPLADVAVIARNVTPYRPFLHEVADEFGLPLRFATGAPLHTNPAVAALLSLLSLPLDPDPWSPRRLIDALVNPYLDWSTCSLETGDADLLYNLAMSGQVVAGLDQWHEAFQRAIGRQVTEDELAVRDDEDDKLSPSTPPGGAQAARLDGGFDAVVARIAPPSQATLRDRVQWVEELLGEDPTQVQQDTGGDETSLRVVARARANPTTAERDVAALRAFKDVLRAMVMADAMFDKIGDDTVSAERFVADLAQAVRETVFTIPGSEEAILVASALQVRGISFDSVALLGLSEGDFPAAEYEDPLLRESDRAWLAKQDLAVEPRLRGDEATLFYQAVTRARRRMLVCRPYLADDGQPWDASPYWLALLRLFKGNNLVKHVRPSDRVTDVASEQELAGVQPSGSVRDASALIRTRVQATPSSWNGDLGAIQERLAERFGPDRPWSSSRLETYAKCPFCFWADHVMELEPRELPQIGFDVLNLGSIYHRVLEDLYRCVHDGDPDRLRAELSAVAEQVYDAAPNAYGFRPTPLWERQKEEMTHVLRHTVEALIEVAGPYKPSVQELAFGLQGEPPLVLHGEPPLLLRGYIDRVDRAPDGRLLIIDYKAGSTAIPAKDLEKGKRLQLPLYALAAQEALGAEVSEGFYWHIGSARPSSLRLARFASQEKGKRGVGGAIATAVDYALSISSAVHAGQFAALPSDGECPRFCPAAAFCEQYRPKVW